MTKPNLLFIISDQQHYRAAGCLDPHFETRHWDRFAAEAIRFDTTYCTTPLCTPSRASMLTGLEPPRSGIRDNGQALQRSTIAPLLQAAGYQTAYIGKWHLSDQPVATNGWDFERGVCDEYRKPNRPLGDDETLAFALEYLNNVDVAEKPFALFVSFDQPHSIYWADPAGPYPRDCLSEPPIRPETCLPPSWFAHDPATAPVSIKALRAKQPNTSYADVMGEDETLWRRYREIYRLCVEQFDASLGAVLDKVKACGFWDDTVTVVTSDHGDMDAHHRLCFKGPLCYEQVQRVPLAIRVPQQFGGTAPRVDDRSLVSLVDLPSTLCEMAGVPLTGTDGCSLGPVLRGERPVHARSEARIWYPEPAIRSIRHGQWKFSTVPGLGEFLYDLAADPDELLNRVDDPTCAAIRDKLRLAIPKE